MDLSISIDDRGPLSVVRVEGEIDVYSAPSLRERLDTLVNAERVRLVLDLTKVAFLDSTGLGVLVGRLKLVRLHGGSLHLVCVNDRILKVFAITGLDKVFAIHRSVDEAVADALGSLASSAQDPAQDPAGTSAQAATPRA